MTPARTVLVSVLLGFLIAIMPAAQSDHAKLLADAIETTVAASGLQVTDDGKVAIRDWSKAAASVLDQDPTEAHIRLARESAAKCAAALVKAAGDSRTVSGTTVSEVKSRICPLYPFC